jgi:glycosyltransferase involved in cell wall biosynthesis
MITSANNCGQARRLKALFLTPRFPYPLIGGDRIKSYYLLKHLAKQHDTYLITFNHGGPASDSQIAAMNAIGVNVTSIPLNPIKAILRTGLNLFRYPLEIGFYTQPEFLKAIKELNSSIQFDIGFAFFMRTAEYIKDYPFKKVLISEDCRTLYQYRSQKSSTNIIQKLVRYWEYKALSKYEPQITNLFDAVTLVTSEDMNALKELNPNAKIKLLTNGVDINCFTMPSEPNVRSGIIFTGKLNIWANQIMIKNIVRNIFPRIKAIHPEIKLKIIGANPPQSIKALANESIEIIENVPQMAPYLQRAALFIHPHEAATGIQNKLIEAMACGCPVVTTQTGVQGIQVENGKNVMIANDTEDMIQKCLLLLEDKELARQIGKNAHNLILETHSWDIVFRQMDEIIDEMFK